MHPNSEVEIRPNIFEGRLLRFPFNFLRVSTLFILLKNILIFPGRYCLCLFFDWFKKGNRFYGLFFCYFRCFYSLRSGPRAEQVAFYGLSPPILLRLRPVSNAGPAAGNRAMAPALSPGGTSDRLGLIESQGLVRCSPSQK